MYIKSAARRELEYPRVRTYGYMEEYPTLPRTVIYIFIDVRIHPRNGNETQNMKETTLYTICSRRLHETWNVKRETRNEKRETWNLCSGPLLSRSFALRSTKRVTRTFSIPIRFQDKLFAASSRTRGTRPPACPCPSSFKTFH